MTRKTASTFVADVLMQGRSPVTVKKILSTYLGLWKFLIREEIVTSGNPWADQAPHKRSSTQGIDAASRRRPYTESEAQQLLGVLSGVDLDVVQLLAVTGMRAEEATSLACADVKVDRRRDLGEHPWRLKQRPGSDASP